MEVRVCFEEPCNGCGASKVLQALQSAAQRLGRDDITICREENCFRFCRQAPAAIVDKQSRHGPLNPAAAEQFLNELLEKGGQ
jgi:NADH:ubiquinone oxidoreductase subunit E